MRIRSLLLLMASLGLGLLVQPTAPFVGARRAEATVSLAYSLAELVARSQAVVVAKAIERRSAWEQLGGGNRIVTYTHLQVVEQVIGSSQTELWVRTLGGAVGKIGQQVAGEASLAIGRHALLFLLPAADGALEVMGAAQGHYPLVEPAADAAGAGAKPPPMRERRLRASPSLGTILGRRGPALSAGEELIGKTLAEAVARIQQLKAQQDAAPER